MQVKVVGKEYLCGTSKKTGKPFSSNVAYVSYKKNGVNGEYVESIWLNPDEYPVDGIQIGGMYNAEYDSSGWLMAFYPVK